MKTHKRRYKGKYIVVLNAEYLCRLFAHHRAFSLEDQARVRRNLIDSIYRFIKGNEESSVLFTEEMTDEQGKKIRPFTIKAIPTCSMYHVRNRNNIIF